MIPNRTLDLRPQGIVLFSTGLDSLVASKLLQQQGLDVLLLTFLNPFVHDSTSFADRASAAADSLGLPIRLVPMEQDYLHLVTNPDHGYGRRLNPCIDCRIYQLTRARYLLAELGASFIATGEVVGQRPMSQQRHIIEMIENRAGVQGIVVRPLCALLLEPTQPELSGLIDRSRLLDISGRGRRRQMSLAADLGITSYPNPAGGCLLTDTFFCERLSDLLAEEPLTSDNIAVLKLGRHLRPAPGVRIVIGRNERENQSLVDLVQCDDTLIQPEDFPGPTGLLRGSWDDEFVQLTGRLVLCYSKYVSGRCVISRGGNDSQIMFFNELPRDEAVSMLIGSGTD